MSLILASRATVYDRYAISRKFTAQETAINVIQGNISLLISASEIEELKKDGVISGGMIPKVDCLVTAVQGSVQRAVIIDGRVPHSILIEMFSEEGIGTLVEE